jgi:hypothetical protein
MILKSTRRRAAAMLLLLASAASLGAAGAARGEETVRVRDASAKYELEVSVAACGGAARRGDADKCNGPARVSLYRKGAGSPFQVLRLRNVELYKDTLAFSPETSAKPRGVYAEEYTFVFQDFDFDGEEDLAILNGRNAGYGGPSYSVYLFDRRSKRFAESRPLSRLTEGVHLGLFFPDPAKRRLAAFSKSGCCYHETDLYSVVRGRPVLVEKIIEDATTGGGAGEGFALVTTKRLVRGRWVVVKKKEKLEERTPAGDGRPD